MFFKFISFKIFIISLALGLLFVYLSSPDPTIVYVYPTPDNAGLSPPSGATPCCADSKLREHKIAKMRKNQ